MERAQRICPASCNRFTSVSPETSSSLVRVSETVSTAICTGTKARSLSIRPVSGWAPELMASESGCIGGRGNGRLNGRWRGHGRQGGAIDRPFAARQLIQAPGILAETAPVHPLIFHQAAHIGTCFRDGYAFHEQQ